MQMQEPRAAELPLSRGVASPYVGEVNLRHVLYPCILSLTRAGTIETIPSFEKHGEKGEAMQRRVGVILAVIAVTLLVFAFAPNRNAQNLKRFTMQSAYVQTGAPVHLASVTYGLDFLFQKAEVENVSDKTVRAVTFGVLLHETSGPKSEPILAATRTIQTNIAPGQTRSIDVLDFSLSEAEQKGVQLKSANVIAEYGIVSVQSDDGTTWNSDYQNSGSFRPASVAAAMNKVYEPRSCRPLVGNKLSSFILNYLPSISPVLAQGYICVGTTEKEVCTNNVQSCTMRVCRRSDMPCPQQACQLQP